MFYKFSSAGLVALCLCVQAAVAQTQTSSSASQSAPATTQKTASGGQTVTGCVAREGESFVLKTDNGTYAFDTSRDLSPYVGKKVTITGRWKATGITTAAPVEGKGTTSGTAESTSGKQATGNKSAAAPNSFAGDLHLHISGQVIGDCESPK